MMGASTDATPKEADLAREVCAYTAPIKASYERLKALRLKQLAANGADVVPDATPPDEERAPRST
jgi:hypothetical protein